MPIQVHGAFQRQGAFFNYLVMCHDLWESADAMVIKGNHTGKSFLRTIKFKQTLLISLQIYFSDFFIALDHENGPITLHSSLSKVVKYVQAGLQKLKQM